MSYSFYGWRDAKCRPVNNGYPGIHTPVELYDALMEIWCADTCTARLRKDWSDTNRTLGQCSITAFLAQDIFGGEVYGIPRPGGYFHCYNVIGDTVFDLTSEQFGDEKLCYEGNAVQSREEHFNDPGKKERYELLCSMLKRRQLIYTAVEYRGRAYAPYSHYTVGAAVLAEDGRIFGGCNIENASYGATNCAERTAVFRAVSEGVRHIKAVAVTGGPAEAHSGTEDPLSEATPCGICRQVIREFSDPSECEVVIARSVTDYRVTTLEKLLPESFGPGNLTPCLS